MKTNWQKIESWLETHFPTGRMNLAPPATNSELEILSSEFKTPIPESLKSFLKAHNGEYPEEIWLLGNWSLLPSCYIFKSWQEQFVLAEKTEGVPETDEFVQKKYWCEGWFPIGYDGSGGYLCIDDNPAVRGVKGQVIMTHVNGFNKRLSESVDGFLEKFLISLISGNFTIEGNCLEHDEEWWAI